MNKKVLIITKNEIVFNNYFLKRQELVSGYYLTYFNNDIQYGSKYIIKRFLDLSLALIALILLSPLLLSISIYIRILDGGPSIIKQNRVGLHENNFKCINLEQ